MCALAFYICAAGYLAMHRFVKRKMKINLSAIMRVNLRITFEEVAKRTRARTYSIFLNKPIYVMNIHDIY